jgi:hypothetical protein
VCRISGAHLVDNKPNRRTVFEPKGRERQVAADRPCGRCAFFGVRGEEMPCVRPRANQRDLVAQCGGVLAMPSACEPPPPHCTRTIRRVAEALFLHTLQTVGATPRVR